MILYHCTDLIWATKIKGTADALGLAARPVRNLGMLEARLADTKPTALIVDLEDPETALALVSRARKENGPNVLRTIAFGPHVSSELFALAKSAGADMALARSGLHAGLPRILQQLSQPDPSADQSAIDR